MPEFPGMLIMVLLLMYAEMKRGDTSVHLQSSKKVCLIRLVWKLWRWVKPCLPVFARTGGNPRITPGSSGVIVASLLEGVAWYAGLPSARNVVDILRRARRLRGIFVFVDPTFSALVSLVFLLCFLLGVLVLFAPAMDTVVSVVCY
jgi:hypothetical protein